MNVAELERFAFDDAFVAIKQRCHAVLRSVHHERSRRRD